jgi:hypothetical protein
VQAVIDWLDLDQTTMDERFGDWSAGIPPDENHFWSPITDAELFSYLREKLKQ